MQATASCSCDISAHIDQLRLVQGCQVLVLRSKHLHVYVKIYNITTRMPHRTATAAKEVLLASRAVLDPSGRVLASTWTAATCPCEGNWRGIACLLYNRTTLDPM
jgi:hypothetical protein